MDDAISEKAYQMARYIKSNYEKFKVVAASSNTYTLDLSVNKNFAVETTDTNAKAIVFANVPSEPEVIIQVSVKLKYTNEVAITHPAAVTWKDGAIPVFMAGKKYLLLYTSYDNGVSWLASAVGAW